MGKIQVNDPIRPRELTTIQGERITIPVPEFRTHLQFRRFAGRAGCNLHLRSIAKRHDEILGAGLREVVVFYSSAQAIKPDQGDLPGRRPSRAPPILRISGSTILRILGSLVRARLSSRNVGRSASYVIYPIACIRTLTHYDAHLSVALRQS